MVGQQLKRDRQQDRNEIIRQRRNVDNMIRELRSAGVAFGGNNDHNAVPRPHLLNVAQHLFVAQQRLGIVGILGRERDHRKISVDQCVRSVLHFARGIAFGVNVRNLFELQGAFQRDRKVDAAPEVEEIIAAEQDRRDLLVQGIMRKELLDAMGHAREIRQQGGRLFASDLLAHLCQVQREKKKHHQLGCKRLGRGHADFGAATGIQSAVAFARQHAAYDVADGQNPGAFGLCFPHCSQRIGGLAGLADRDNQRAGIQNGIPITKL